MSCVEYELCLVSSMSYVLCRVLVVSCVEYESCLVSSMSCVSCCSAPDVLSCVNTTLSTCAPGSPQEGQVNALLQVCGGYSCLLKKCIKKMSFFF